VTGCQAIADEDLDHVRRALANPHRRRIKAAVETGDVPLKTRLMLRMMSAFVFMLPKDTLRENAAELREKK